MAETNTPTKWKVVSTIAFYWGKRIMKPGQIFMAVESTIPQEFKQHLIAVDAPVTVNPGAPHTPFIEEGAPVLKEVQQYHTKQRFGSDFYDVVDSKGKRISEHKLTEEEAIAMVKSLMG